jgi:cytochrome c oxidase cbb3-type subunit III
MGVRLVSDHGHPRVPETHPDEIDAPTGTATTGHEWDGIKELNTPLPRWWLWVFYATHVWALGYIILYPSIPLLRDATTGLLGWHSRAEVASDISTVEASRADIFARIRDLPLGEIAADEELRGVAFRGGESAFKVNCVQCHGADAAGGFGYANLNDDDWIWGGTLDDIHYTIAHGVRFAADPETRFSEMPAFGRDALLDREQINAVTQHVLALAGQPHDAAIAQNGAALYADNCAACHGETGEGMRELGAPRLNDAVWLYGSNPEQVLAQVHSPRHGNMPAWGGRLDETTIKQLTIYVHGLGGGEATPEEQQNALAE